MLAEDGAAAHVERRREPPIDAKPFASGSGADDIDDGVDRTYFVEMHCFNGDGMDSGFGLAEEFKRTHGAGLHCFRERRRADDGENGRQGAMRCVCMRVGTVFLGNRQEVRLIGMLSMRMPFMRMPGLCGRMGVGRLVRWMVRRNDVDLCGRDAAASYLAHLEMRTHIQRHCGLLKMGERNAGVNQGAEQHVTANA